MNQTPDDLGKKIREAQERQRQNAGGAQADDATTRGETAKAMRAATDLVAAVAVGAFLGYWTDRWLGTQPWGMIVFFFLGVAAGFLNIYRSQTGQEFKVGFRNTDQTDKKE